MVNKRWQMLCNRSELWKKHCYLFSYETDCDSSSLEKNNYKNIFKQLYNRENNYRMKKFKKQLLNFHSGKVMGVYVSSHSDIIVSLAFDRTVQIHNIKTLQLLNQFETDTMKCSSFYKDELLAIGTFNRSCLLYNIKSDEPPIVFTGHVNTVCVIDINEKYMVSASLDKYIFVWDYRLKQRTKEIIIPDEYYNRNDERNENSLFINFSLTELKIKNEFIIAAIHNYILIWNIEKNFELIRVVTLDDTINSFDTDGYYIYCTQLQSYCEIPILEEESDIILYRNKSLNVISKIIIDEKRIAFWYVTSQSSSNSHSQHNHSNIKIISREDHKELFKCETPGINVLNINKDTIVYGDYYGALTLYDFS
jgi:WD40 repeat protein